MPRLLRAFARARRRTFNDYNVALIYHHFSHNVNGTFHSFIPRSNSALLAKMASTRVAAVTGANKGIGK